MIKPILIEDQFILSGDEPRRHGELKPPLQYFPIEIIDDPDEINPDFIVYEVTNGLTKTFCWYEVHVINPSPSGRDERVGLKHVFPDLQSSQNFVQEKLK